MPRDLDVDADERGEPRLPNLFEATVRLRARPWFGHAFGLAGLLVALWLRFEIGDWLVGYPFITFFPAVVLTAFLGGTTAGILCAVFSGLAAWYFFVPPYRSLTLVWPSGFIAMGFYAVLVSLDLYLIHVMIRTLERLQTARSRADVLVERQRTMFAELQHRVANNMQFVSSLLALQKRQVAADPASGPAALDQAVERLRTMARIHRRLYDPAAATVDFGQHLQEICTDLLGAAGARNVVCHVEAPTTDLPLETLITLSLITTEAVTNSLKHAWPKGEQGVIRVALERLEPGRVALSVSDDGRGTPADYDPAKSGSLGLRIIRSLAQQIGGELSVAADGGTTTRVVFAG